MNRSATLLTVFLGLACLGACTEDYRDSADNPGVSAPPPAAGTKYGSGIDAGAVLTVPEAYAKIDEIAGQPVRVRGTIVDVCAKRGCWMNLAADGDARVVQVKVDDGVIVFPMSAKGRDATAQGVAEKRALTLEQTRARHQHEAEEQGKPFDPASVTEPATIVVLRGTGAVVN